LFSFKKKYISSNAVRNKFIGSFMLNKFFYFKKLRYLFKSKSGRSKYNGIVIFSKSSLKKRFLYPKVNFNTKSVFNVSFVFNQLFNFKLKKMYNLYLSYSGFF
jgi:hypothetical protein